MDGPGVIGRDPASAGLTLADPEASRRHASIIPEGRSLNIEDLGSTNGTFVNGQRIDQAVVLVPGDRLSVNDRSGGSPINGLRSLAPGAN